VVSSTPRPHFTPGKDPEPIVQEAGWAPGPVWTGGKSRLHGDSIPDRPARSSVGIPTELPGPTHSDKYRNHIPPKNGYLFDVWLTVHRSSMWNKKPTRCHLVLYLFLPYKLLFISCSTCFGPPCAHLQELTT